MVAKTIMVQGTGSGVGKSIIACAICRLLRQDGYRVAPFKAQNMSNNAYVTREGGEISRAQAVQAEACGIEPSVLMNPILLKPTTDIGAQVIVMGKPFRTMIASAYEIYKTELLSTVHKALRELMDHYDVVVLEGAGSPAEINLREHDLVNMAMARAARAPVLLVGDIDKGGVFAQLVGTMALLTEEERPYVKAFVINKFRGDRALLTSGLDELEQRTARKVLGVIPYLHDVRIDEEDSIGVRSQHGRQVLEGLDPAKRIAIEVIRLPRIANFTDVDPLEREPDVSLSYLERPPAEGVPNLLIIPGSKSTIADLAFLKTSGFAAYIARCSEAGTEVIGICGGYQMLGQRILDPERVEATVSEAEGLGYLETVTVFHPEKLVAQVSARHLESGCEVQGYEIHMGRMEGNGNAQAVFQITQRHGEPAVGFDGTRSSVGRVWGTHIHGLFDGAPFRQYLLNRFRRMHGVPEQSAVPDDSRRAERLQAYDRLAECLRREINLDLFYAILKEGV